MKKTIGFICGLTILSSCSYLESHDMAFWKDSGQNPEAARRDPMYNTAGTPANAMPRAGNPSAISPSMQIRRSEPLVGNPNIVTPPLPGTEINASEHPSRISSNIRVQSMPAYSQATPAQSPAPIMTPPAPPSSAPQASSPMPGNGAIVPPAPESQPNNSDAANTMSLMSMELVQDEPQLVSHMSDEDTAKKSSDNSDSSSDTKSSDPNISAKSAALPPLPSANSSNTDEFPKLSEIPPTPAAPKPASSEPRVKQMKQELNSMQQQRAASESGKPVAMKTEPLPPLPAPSNAPAQPVALSSVGDATPSIGDKPGLMPDGPTIVVHSKKAGSKAPARASEPEQMAMPAKPMTTAASAPVPPIPPAFASAGKPQANKAQPMGSPPKMLGSSSQPMPVMAREPVPAASDYPQDMDHAAMPMGNETGSGMVTTPGTGRPHYRLLPESRYAKLRGAR